MIYILQLIFSLCSCDDAQANQHQGGHGGGLLDGHRTFLDYLKIYLYWGNRYVYIRNYWLLCFSFL